MKEKKKIVVGVSGGIAAYKACQFVSDLVKKDYHIDVIMTKSATEFINPLTFESLTKNHVMTDTFDRSHASDIRHITLAREANLFIIAPATANVIAKIAAGIADDMLTSTILPATCPILIAPAMNVHMYQNPITQRNIETLKQYGYIFIEPEDGILACGDVGSGKLANIPTLLDYVEQYVQKDKPLSGKHVLVTAGPTIEKIDPVRYLTNHSSGKMGYAIARQARNLGAEVTLISGPTQLDKPNNIHCISVESASDMFYQVKKHYQKQDFIIKAAAVADYTYEHYEKHKIKKQDNQMTLSLNKTDDILKYIGENKLNHQVLCGFAMETQHLLENAREKLHNKNCDILIANKLTDIGAGFKKDTNKVTILTKDNTVPLDLMSKDEVALEILKTCINISKNKEN